MFLLCDDVVFRSVNEFGVVPLKPPNNGLLKKKALSKKKLLIIFFILCTK